MKKLNPNAEKWVRALESGEYEQQRDGYLRTFDENKKPQYCCLGVACALYAKAKKTPMEVLLMRDSHYLPAEVRDWLGLQSEMGRYGSTDLAQENDMGVSFKQIAQIIREKPEGLFEEGK